MRRGPIVRAGTRCDFIRRPSHHDFRSSLRAVLAELQRPPLVADLASRTITANDVRSTCFLSLFAERTFDCVAAKQNGESKWRMLTQRCHGAPRRLSIIRTGRKERPKSLGVFE